MNIGEIGYYCVYGFKNVCPEGETSIVGAAECTMCPAGMYISRIIELLTIIHN